METQRFAIGLRAALLERVDNAAIQLQFQQAFIARVRHAKAGMVGFLVSYRTLAGIELKTKGTMKREVLHA